uniref:Uncharacterized protein n=1 Tax=Plectus sambesii TaxID=2011161 RepID=A0A914WUJ4_9BILA
MTAGVAIRLNHGQRPQTVEEPAGSSGAKDIGPGTCLHAPNDVAEPNWNDWLSSSSLQNSLPVCEWSGHFNAIHSWRERERERQSPDGCGGLDRHVNGARGDPPPTGRPAKKKPPLEGGWGERPAEAAAATMMKAIDGDGGTETRLTGPPAV